MTHLKIGRTLPGTLLLLATGLLLSACSTSNSPGGAGNSADHITPAGTSVAGWTVPAGGSLHAKSATSDYVGSRGVGSCTECHGDDLAGGISRVSCYGNAAGCHHGTIALWFDNAVGAAQPHGSSAKMAPGSSSFFACQICHGADFRTARGGFTCFSCHTRAPHPNGPWHSGGTDNNHANVDSANAPVCILCHADTVGGNPNNPHHPSTPASPGAAPGCFNGTMCHNQAGHPAGWQAGGQHGAAAKDVPDATHGLASCRTCHGDTYGGSVYSMDVSCYTQSSWNGFPCHSSSISRPHPPGITWQRAGVPTHRDTAQGNAPACGQCHRAQGVTPGTEGCFTNTLCHGGN